MSYCARFQTVVSLKSIQPMIGIHHIQLAATAFGLGTSFTGSINTAAQGYPPIIEALKIPEGYIPFGTFLIGYPAEIYQRIPVRRPLTVTWC